MSRKQTNSQVSHISFKPLLKLLIDLDMDTLDLCRKTGISTSTMAAIRTHKSVTLDTVAKICLALDCPIESVVEIVKGE